MKRSRFVMGRVYLSFFCFILVVLFNGVFFNGLIERGCQHLSGKMWSVAVVYFGSFHRDRQRQRARVETAYTEGRVGNILSVGFVLYQVHGACQGLCSHAGNQFLPWCRVQKGIHLHLKLRVQPVGAMRHGGRGILWHDAVESVAISPVQTVAQPAQQVVELFVALSLLLRVGGIERYNDADAAQRSCLLVGHSVHRIGWDGVEMGIIPLC